MIDLLCYFILVFYLKQKDWKISLLLYVHPPPPLCLSLLPVLALWGNLPALPAWPWRNRFICSRPARRRANSACVLKVWTISCLLQSFILSSSQQQNVFQSRSQPPQLIQQARRVPRAARLSMNPMTMLTDFEVKRIFHSRCECSS